MCTNLFVEIYYFFDWENFFNSKNLSFSQTSDFQKGVSIERPRLFICVHAYSPRDFFTWPLCPQPSKKCGLRFDPYFWFFRSYRKLPLSNMSFCFQLHKWLRPIFFAQKVMARFVDLSDFSQKQTSQIRCWEFNEITGSGKLLCIRVH